MINYKNTPEGYEADCTTFSIPGGRVTFVQHSKSKAKSKQENLNGVLEKNYTVHSSAFPISYSQRKTKIVSITSVLIQINWPKIHKECSTTYRAIPVSATSVFLKVLAEKALSVHTWAAGSCVVSAGLSPSPSPSNPPRTRCQGPLEVL